MLVCSDLASLVRGALKRVRERERVKVNVRVNERVKTRLDGELVV